MFFKMLITQIPSAVRILDLTKYMNDQMVESDFQIRMSLEILPEIETQPDMSLKGTTLQQHSHIYHYSVTRRCNLYNGISAIVFF